MRRLEPDELQSGAATLAEAFWDDPLMHIIAPDERRRTTAAPWFFELSLKYALRYGGEVSCNEEATATAIWFPPGNTDISPVRMLRIGFAALPFKAGISGTRRFFSALSTTEKFHKAVEGPHWYLLAIGTRPALQGTGLGSALVDLGTSRADSAGVPCYLETGTDSNVAFYKKRGFEVTGEAEVYGFKLRGMVRPPK